MPLSEQEERAFAQIAAAMGSAPLAADPNEKRLRRARLLRAGSEVLAVATFVALVAMFFFPVGTLQVALLGAAIFLASLSVGLYLLGGRRARSFLGRPFSRRSRRPAPVTSARTILPARKPLLKRLEERWERRTEERFGPR